MKSRDSNILTFTPKPKTLDPRQALDALASRIAALGENATRPARQDGGLNSKSQQMLTTFNGLLASCRQLYAALNLLLVMNEADGSFEVDAPEKLRYLTDYVAQTEVYYSQFESHLNAVEANVPVVAQVKRRLEELSLRIAALGDQAAGTAQHPNGRLSADHQRLLANINHLILSCQRSHGSLTACFESLHAASLFDDASASETLRDLTAHVTQAEGFLTDLQTKVCAAEESSLVAARLEPAMGALALRLAAVNAKEVPAGRQQNAHDAAADKKLIANFSKLLLVCHQMHATCKDFFAHLEAAGSLTDVETQSYLLTLSNCIQKTEDSWLFIDSRTRADANRGLHRAGCRERRH